MTPCTHTLWLKSAGTEEGEGGSIKGCHIVNFKRTKKMGLFIAGLIIGIFLGVLISGLFFLHPPKWLPK